MNAIPLEGGRTRIDKALQLAKDKMFTSGNGARRGVKKMLILLTDGSQSQDRDAKDPSKISEAIRRTGVDVVVIGIGNGVNPTELSNLAGGSNWYRADNFDVLKSDRFIQKIKRAGCDLGKKLISAKLISLNFVI